MFECQVDFSVVHSSSNSVSRADTSRRHEALLGKIVDMRVHHLNSRLIRSSLLVLCRRTLCAKDSRTARSHRQATLGPSTFLYLWRAALPIRAHRRLSSHEGAIAGHHMERKFTLSGGMGRSAIRDGDLGFVV